MGILTLNTPLIFPTFPTSVFTPSTAASLNAAGKAATVIGKVRLQAGTGSKTISSAGGKIWIEISGTPTFASGSTSITVGIQDVNTSTGLHDQSFDVFASFVGGRGALTASTWNKMTMASGTKTIAQGDLIAIVVSMTARGGSDSINLGTQLNIVYGAMGFPYGTAENASVAAKSTGSLVVALIEFDDGTVGWIEGTLPWTPVSVSNTSFTALTFNSGSTPDEYCSVFPGLDATVVGIGLHLKTDSVVGIAHDVILYEDPLGTPIVLATVTPNVNLYSGGASTSEEIFTISPIPIVSTKTYGIALRPTTVTDIVMDYFNYASGFDKLKLMGPFGTNAKMASRTDQTGAFTETQIYHAMPAYLQLSTIGAAPGGQSVSIFGGQHVERQTRISYLKFQLRELEHKIGMVRYELQELTCEEWDDKAEGKKFSLRGKWKRTKKE